MPKLPDPLKSRKADHPIEQLFLKRWSPRALSQQAVTDSQLMSMFEAARWAPSTYNEQEWRYLYARKGTGNWQVFFDLLVEGNRAWCHLAQVLVVVLSKKTFSKTGKPNPVHTFDAGLSAMNLMLQGASMNIIAHGMAGFDRDKARSSLQIPEDFSVEAMVAIGHPGDPGLACGTCFARSADGSEEGSGDRARRQVQFLRCAAGSQKRMIEPAGCANASDWRRNSTGVATCRGLAGEALRTSVGHIFCKFRNAPPDGCQVFTRALHGVAAAGE